MRFASVFVLALLLAIVAADTTTTHTDTTTDTTTHDTTTTAKTDTTTTTHTDTTTQTDTTTHTDTTTKTDTTTAATTTHTDTTTDTTAKTDTTTTTDHTETTTVAPTTTHESTTTPAPTTTQIPVVCANTTAQLTGGLCFGRFPTFPVQWCARDSLANVQATADKLAADIVSRMNTVTLDSITEHFNQTCNDVGGQLARNISLVADFVCIGEQARGTACLDYVAEVNGCANVTRPSCGFCGRVVELACDVTANTPLVAKHCETQANCTSEYGFARMHCRNATFDAHSCSSAPTTAPVCAITPQDAIFKDDFLDFLGNSTHNLREWANFSYCHHGGGAVANYADFNANIKSIACSELSMSFSCNPAQCNDHPFSPVAGLPPPPPSVFPGFAPSSFVTPVCCGQCETFYAQACNGGDPIVACKNKGCANSYCWGKSAPFVPIPSVTPTPTPSPSGGGLSGGAVAGIVISLLVVIGGGGGYVYYRKKNQQSKDTALREYSSFPGASAA